MKSFPILPLIAALLLAACDQLPRVGSQPRMAFHFDAPATTWEECLPLGNGRIGLTPDGGIDRETLVLNEATLWSGSRQEADNPDAVRALGRIRELILGGHAAEAEALLNEAFICRGVGTNSGDAADKPFGSYQMLGSLTLGYAYDGNERTSTTDYRRELRLEEAVSKVTFRRGKTTYTREAFTSFAADVAVVRLTADREHTMQLRIGLNRPERYAVAMDGNDLTIHGRLYVGDGQLGQPARTPGDTGVVVNGVLITQAGEYLQYVGRTELTLRGRKVVARRNRLIPVASMTAEDATVKAAIKKFYDESPLNEVIGRVTARIEGKEGLGNLVTDAEATVNGADFAFQNAGGIRIGALEPGDMTAKMVYEMDPFGNEVNVVELTPAEMRDLIRVSHRYNKRRHAVDLLVSGMTYTLYTKNGEPDRIEMAFPDGRPLEEGRYYRVALNDYIVSAYKFSHARAAKPTGKSSEETIIEYIRSRKEIAPQAPRTKLIEE